VVGNVRRDINDTDELDFVAYGLEPLGHFKSNYTTITVTRNGVRSRPLGPLDCCDIAGNHLIDGGEEGVARLETTSTKRVEQTLVLEVLGEIDENENLSDTGVHKEDGGLAAGELEGNDRVVFLGLAVLRDQAIYIVSKARDDGVLEDLDGGDFREVEVCLSLALEPGDEASVKVILKRENVFT